MSPQPWTYFFPKGVLQWDCQAGLSVLHFNCSSEIWFILADLKKIYNFQASEKGRSRLEFGAHLYWWNLSSLGIIVH